MLSLYFETNSGVTQSENPSPPPLAVVFPLLERNVSSPVAPSLSFIKNSYLGNSDRTSTEYKCNAFCLHITLEV